MKRTIISGLLFIFLLAVFSFVNAQTTKFKTWKITVSQSGGYAGIQKSYTLDNEGNLNRINKNRQDLTKVDEAKTAEIRKLVEELNLPGTKLKTFKGERIYDGIYSSLVISLDGKDYAVEGAAFEDAEFLALSKEQTATLERLKAKLDELDGFLLDSMNNR